jgi:diguanylate cyclase (GGDEF)-like protein
VNDTLGHDAGDYVLREATDRMAGVVRRSDLLARIGGDEFVVILPDLPDAAALEALSTRIIAQFEQPIDYEDNQCTIGASIGAVHVEFQPAITVLEDLLHRADLALCEVKNAGRNAYRLFDDSLGRRRDDHAKTARDLSRGLAHEEFVVHFQPVVDTLTDTVTGVELLARWTHPEQGLLLPETFLGVAEDFKLLDELGIQVLERSCEAVRAIRATGQDLPVLHLNLARSQVLSYSMIDQINWQLDNAGIDPASLAIEVGEDACIGRGAEAVMARLNRLRELGHPTVLDSFGQEAGAIKMLAETRAVQVKISRDIFKDARDGIISGNNQLLVRAAISAGENLGISVVAKGLETELQAEAMHALGIAEMQGNIIAPPMPPDAFAAWLSGRKILHDYMHASIKARPKAAAG